MSAVLSNHLRLRLFAIPRKQHNLSTKAKVATLVAVARSSFIYLFVHTPAASRAARIEHNHVRLLTPFVLVVFVDM